jgi:hypothetical protein
MEEAVRDRKEHAARNQSLWREINELALTNRRGDSTFQTFVCECAAETCTEEVSLTKDEYEAVRMRANHFFVKPGHVFPEFELVVVGAGADGGRYQVVEKFGEAGKEAAERDPRVMS